MISFGATLYLYQMHRRITILFLLFISVSPQVNSQINGSTESVTIDFSIAASQKFINPPYVSGVINDPSDPAATIGIKVDVKENSSPIAAADYTITVTSSNTSVVTVANVTITKYNGYAIAKILPTGVGYSDVKLKLAKGSSTDNLTIKYAASAAAATPLETHFHTGMSDASAAIVLDSNYMLIGDDEINSLFVFDRKNSGLPVQSYDYQNLLGLTDGSSGNYKEIDLEAAVRSTTNPNRIYWISSLGTAGSSNNVKPNINRIFATDVTGTGSATNISAIGYYGDIRNKLISWGNTNGYNFTAGAASGHDAKTIDGFNIEGMCFGPDNTSLYIGFRAPLVPVSSRTKALIAPILNFETWFNSGSPTGNPSFGSPIELNLGGRGIRDIIRLSNGVYIIIAGNYAATPLNGAVYKWTGLATDAPVLIPDFNIASLNVEAIAEITENNILAENKLQFISDNGSYDFYNDGTEAKDLSQNNFKKFRSDLLVAGSSVLPIYIIEFNATNKEITNELWWKINPENVQEVVLEKSENGIDFFKQQVYTQPTAEMKHIDASPIKNTVWYRLKIITKKNTTVFSGVIKLQRVKSVELEVYPNPVNNGKLNITTSLNGEKELSVLTITGKRIFQKKFTSNSIYIEIHGVKTGYYLIRIRNNKTEITRRIFSF